MGFTYLKRKCGRDVSDLDVLDWSAAVTAVLGHERGQRVLDLVPGQRLLGQGHPGLVRWRARRQRLGWRTNEA